MIAVLGTLVYVAVLLAVAQRVAGKPEEHDLRRDTGRRAHPEQLRRVEVGAMSRARVAIATPIVLIGALAGLLVAPQVAHGGTGAVGSTLLLIWPFVRLRRWWLRTPGESSILEEALTTAQERFGRRGLVAALGAGVVILLGAAYLDVPLGALIALVPTLALVAPTLGLVRRRHAVYKHTERALAGALNAPDVPVALRVEWEPGTAEWTALSLPLPETDDPHADRRISETLRARIGGAVRVRVEHTERAVEVLPPAPLPERVELPLADCAPDGLALRLGVALSDDEEPEWAWWDPDAADPHALIVGPTRSGKSVALRCLLAQALAGGWDVILADPKGVDYRWADGLPGVMRASGDEAYEAIDWAVDEMKRRQTWMEEHAPPTAANLGEVPDNPYRPLLLISDETAELVELGGDATTPKDRKERQEETKQRLGSLARRSRFVSIVMAVATQRPDASILGGEVRGNLGTRVLTGEGESQHRLMAFGRDDIEPLPPGYPNGRARVMVGGAGPVALQVPWVSAEDVLAAHAPAHESAPDRPPAAWSEMHGAGEAPAGGTIELSLDDDEEERP